MEQKMEGDIFSHPEMEQRTQKLSTFSSMHKMPREVTPTSEKQDKDATKQFGLSILYPIYQWTAHHLIKQIWVTGWFAGEKPSANYHLNI